MRHFLMLLTMAFMVLLGPNAGQAQDSTNAPTSRNAVVLLADDTPDYEAWDRLADRVETALEAGRASSMVFQSLRQQLAEWRSAFTDAQEANEIQINTLRTQIATLGPAPAEGSTESAVLTDLRDRLTGQLNEARAPIKRAEQAHSRANVLIGSIDSLIRARDADALISLGPSPLGPANWSIAARALSNSIKLAVGGVSASWQTETQRAALRRDLPLTIFLGIVGLLLLLRGRVWVMRIGAGVYRRASGYLRGVLGFLISLGQVAAPMAGIAVLIEALNTAGVLDLRGQVIADSLPQLVLFSFGALWLGNRVFGTASTSRAAINLPGALEPAQGRLSMALLGLIYGLNQVILNIADYEGYSEATLVVLGFPLIVAAGLLLVRLGRLLRRHVLAMLSTDSGIGFRLRLLSVLGWVLVLAGIVGPIAAAIGYGALAEHLIYPAILTVAVLAAIEVLHIFFTDLHGLFTKRHEEEPGDALIPILASFVVALAALPLLALIWGARVTDLTEIWTRMGEGFQLGAAQVTPQTFLTIVVVFTIGYVATRLVQSTLKTTILPKTKLDKGGQNAITSGLGYVGIFLASLIAITSAGVDLSALAIVAGALSVGIGFGLQNVVSNFVSGIILLIERPISEGDWIEVGGEMGYVRNISVRSTVIETFDRTDVIVPNSDLISQHVINYTRGNSIGRVIVSVGAAYGTDTRKVEGILREVAEAHPLVTVNPPPLILFQGFGADSLDFEIRAILQDVNFSLSVKSDMNHEIARRFAEEDIEIPFAQRDIWLRNPEVLTGLGAGQEKAEKAKTAPGRHIEQDANKARVGLELGDMHGDEGGAGDGSE